MTSVSQMLCHAVAPYDQLHLGNRFVLLVNFRCQRIEEMRSCTRSLLDAMTGISDSTKLAEEHYRKLMECSARIESCVSQVHDHANKLSTFNAQFASSADQSLGAIRAQSVSSLVLAAQSVGSLVSAESSTSSRLTGSIGTAAQEVEQLKAEQLQLCRRYDRLLAIFGMHAQTMQQTDGAPLRQVQRIASAEDGTPVLRSPVTSGADVNANQPGAGFGQSPTSSADGVMQSGGASGSVLSDSSFTASTPRSGRSRHGRGARFAGRMTRAVMGRGGRYSAMHRTANGQQAFLTPPARPTSLENHEVVPARTEFRTPRGRLRGSSPGRRQISSRSVGPLPRDVPKSMKIRGAANILRGRGSRRGKSAAPRGDFGSNAGMVRQDSGDGAAYSHSTDDTFQSAMVVDLSPTTGGGKSAPVKARIRKRAKSATPALDTGTADDQPGIAAAQPGSSLDHKVLPAPTDFKTPRGHPRGRTPGRQRSNSRSVDTLLRGVPESATSSIAVDRSGGIPTSSYSTDGTFQSTIVVDSSPTTGGGDSAPLATRGTANDQQASTASAAQPRSSLDHKIVHTSTEFKTPRARPLGRTPGRRRISSHSVDTLPRDEPKSTSGISSDSSGEVAPIKARGHRRAKSATPAVLPSPEKISPGEVDGTLTSAKGQSPRQGLVVANIDSVDGSKSARQRSRGRQRGLFLLLTVVSACHFCIISICYLIS